MGTDALSGMTVPLVYGVDRPDHWRDQGWQLQLNLTASPADTTLHWRVVDSGKLHCISRLVDFEEGTYTEVCCRREGTVTLASDLASHFDIEGAGFAHVEAYSDTRAVAELRGPDGARWSIDRDGMDSPVEADLYGLEPGTWTVAADELRGTDAMVRGLVMDLPAWTHYVLSGDWFDDYVEWRTS